MYIPLVFIVIFYPIVKPVLESVLLTKWQKQTTSFLFNFLQSLLFFLCYFFAWPPIFSYLDTFTKNYPKSGLLLGCLFFLTLNILSAFITNLIFNRQKPIALLILLRVYSLSSLLLVCFHLFLVFIFR